MKEEKIKQTKEYNRIEWQSGEEKDFFDFATWMFTLGQMQRDIEKCRRILEECLNQSKLDIDSSPLGKRIFEVYYELQVMEHQIKP